MPTETLTMSTRQIIDICREALQPENQESVIRTWAAGMLFGNSHENPIVIAYLSLDEIGPKNDWNGERGVAMRLKQEMEFALVYKAATLKTRMQDAAMEVMTEFRLAS